MNRLLLVLALVSVQSLYGQNPLLIPDTLSGTNIALTLDESTHQFYAGQNTASMGANGDILGPTLLLNQGDFVNFSVNNQLADTTTIHWHGLHVAPENDGGPHTFIAPNTTWSPGFTIMDKAATYWYHPHLHHKTEKHVSFGIAGLILVRDSDESALTLPRSYGIDDFPLVLQTKDFDASNEIIYHSNSDDVAMVNATIDPFLEVPAQVVRYRILNGSSQRVFNLGLSNGQSFYQIASDGGLLSTPYQTTRLLLAPGERAEILIDFSGMAGQSVRLRSIASQIPNGIYGATQPGMAAMLTLNGYNPNPLNGNNFDLVEFNVVAQTANPVISIPTGLVSVVPIPSSSANITRNLVFSPVSPGPNHLNGDFLINNTSFDMGIVNYTVPLDNIEIWDIFNQSGIAHPFHIHDVQFYIMTRNGVAPPVNEQGRKDVVLVRPQETVRFIAQFEDFANDSIPYMYHCHMLPHEDAGMMGQFIVSAPATSAAEPVSEGLLVYPNPNQGSFTLELKENYESAEVKICDPLGRLVSDLEMVIHAHKIQISGLPRGVFFLSMEINGKQLTQRIVVQ